MGKTGKIVGAKSGGRRAVRGEINGTEKIGKTGKLRKTEKSAK